LGVYTFSYSNIKIECFVNNWFRVNSTLIDQSWSIFLLFHNLSASSSSFLNPFLKPLWFSFCESFKRISRNLGTSLSLWYYGGYNFFFIRKLSSSSSSNSLFSKKKKKNCTPLHCLRETIFHCFSVLELVFIIII